MDIIYGAQVPNRDASKRPSLGDVSTISDFPPRRRASQDAALPRDARTGVVDVTKIPSTRLARQASTTGPPVTPATPASATSVRTPSKLSRQYIPCLHHISSTDNKDKSYHHQAIFEIFDRGLGMTNQLPPGLAAWWTNSRSSDRWMPPLPLGW